MSAKKALIIDDHPHNRLVLEQLLNLSHIESISLPDLTNLAAILDDIGPVDMVFLDLEMPILNGYQVLAIIKQNHHYQSTHMIAYTVHISEVENVFDKGFDSFLGKPVSLEEFPQQILRILQGESICYIP
ncbi:hypothetical protein MASR2M15_18480 [Anaerolineales bacterium]